MRLNMGNKKINQLYDALLLLESRDDCKRFMADLCTPKEIIDLTDRLEVARLLKETDMSYREISGEIGVSTTTVTRVARFLTQEPHKGYELVLNKMENAVKEKG